MRKYLPVLFLSQFIIAFASGQDIKKIAEDFEKSMKDPKGFPYGHNKAAGKYYDTPVVYKDDFNKVVDRFFSNPYRMIDGQGRFF